MAEEDGEKVLRGGDLTAVLRVRAEVCEKCGERLYSEETVRKFEEVRGILRRGETAKNP